MLVLAALLLLHVHADPRHESAKLFQIVNPEGFKSYVLTSVRTAWVKNPHDLPRPARRAIQKSVALIFDYAFWAPVESVSVTTRDSSRFQGPEDVRVALPSRAIRVLERLNVPSFGLERPRPGVVLAQCLDAMITIYEERRARFVVPRVITIPEDLSVLAGSIVGPGRTLAREVQSARADAGDGRVSIEQAVWSVGRRAGLEPVAASTRSETECAMETMLDTVTVSDLARALDHLGEEIEADDFDDRFRRFYLDALYEVANARFFHVPRTALLQLRASGLETRLRGFEAYRDRARAVGAALADATLDRVARGGAFVVLDLGTFEGEGGRSGFKRRLLARDLDVVPLEINCEGAFH